MQVCRQVVSVAQWLACRAHKENVYANHRSFQCDCRDNNLGQVVSPNVPLFAKVQNWYLGNETSKILEAMNVAAHC